MTKTESSPLWDDGSWSGLPQLTQDLRADVCVVGLGGSGLTAIQTLLAHGLNVVGIDAGEVASGAAGRNGGFLLAGLAKFYQETVQLLGRGRAAGIYRCTLQELDRITMETPTAVRREGSLRIAFTDEERADCDAQFHALRADGFPVEYYSGAEGEGLLLLTDGAFNPLLRCRLLAQSVRESGARIFEKTCAVKIESDAVHTGQGCIRCSFVVVAVDGRIEHIFPELAAKVRTARLQMLGTAPTREITLKRPVYARWGYDYWQQLPDGRVVLGGGRDLALDEEWTANAEPTEKVQTYLERFLRARIGVHAPVTHRWAASVGYTADGMPIVKEVLPRVWTIGGYNGTGNVVGALCARSICELIVSGESEFYSLLRGSEAHKEKKN
jgi:glycine/D-amino acid oxidase-like deaminating enzyme